MTLPENISKILIVEVAGIGDGVMAVPSLRALRKKYPQAELTLMISPRAYSLLQYCPYVNEIIQFDIDYFKRWPKLLNVFKAITLVRLIFSLRFKHFDIGINLYRIATFMGWLRMKMFFSVVRPKVSVGRIVRGTRKLFSTHYVEDVPARIYEAESELAVVSLVGACTDNISLELWPQKSDEEHIDEFFKEFNIKKEDCLIGINSHSLQLGNLWNEERFGKVADLLSETYKTKILFFGSLFECGRIEAIISHMRHEGINCAGRFTLSQYASCLKRLSLFITLDSGPMHIASVFKVPTVALFGGADVARFGPYSNENAIIVRKDVGCNPCQLQEKCKKGICMKAISVSDVIKACEKLMK